MSKRITAEFVPQEWINDYAVEVDPQGETKWDVTELLTSKYSEDQLRKLRDDTLETDDLRGADNAPQWVRDWSGPFVVRVEDSIADYLEE